MAFNQLIQERLFGPVTSVNCRTLRSGRRNKGHDGILSISFIEEMLSG